MGARSDVAELSLEQMSPELRRLIAYEPNDALDVRSPQPLIAEVLRANPVVRWERGVGLFGMEDVRAGCRNQDLVSMNPETGVNFGMGSKEPLIPVHLDGPRHVHFRKLLALLFAVRRIARLEPKVRELADDLIDAFAAKGRAELYESFCVPLPSILFLELFGMPLEDLPFLIQSKDRILKNEGADQAAHEEIGLAVGAELDEHLRARLHERLSDGARYDDLLDAFIHFEVDGHRLQENEIVNVMHMFMIAGLDTVTSSLSCIIGWLAHHPVARRRLVADPSRLPTAIEELLRYESPVHSGGGRWALRDTEINGVPLAKGDMVYLCWASANLDPAYFDQPLLPNLERHPNPHIAFALGRHHCLGTHLARLELRVALEQLHRRIPDYSVPDGEEIGYEHASVRQASHLPLEFDPA